MKYVLGAQCVKCGREYDAVPDLTTCSCGGILDIVYDYAAIRGTFPPGTWRTAGTTACGATGPSCRWRPTPPPRPCGWAGPRSTRPPAWPGAGLKALYLKDDGRIPPASLKDRPPPWRWSRPVRPGRTPSPAPPRGNAASSLAGNAAAAGLSTYIFVPSRAPKGKVAQLRIFGSTVISVDGSYEDTFALSKAAIDRWAGTTATRPSIPTCPRARRPSPWRFWSSWAGRDARLHRPFRGGRAAPSPEPGRA